MINVVAASIKFGDKILIAQRLTGDNYGKWEFPGGKVEANESDKQALKRELMEEMNITINVNKMIETVGFNYPNKEIQLSLYECEYVSGKMVLNNHNRIELVYENELLNYDLSSTDLEIVKRIRAKNPLQMILNKKNR